MTNLKSISKDLKAIGSRKINDKEYMIRIPNEFIFDRQYEDYYLKDRSRVESIIAKHLDNFEIIEQEKKWLTIVIK